ncbi:hypothetical protein SAMN05720354_106116 [Nitrosospira sp. Nsp1]|nr:hypothetical protein SAMN05720354_106116 [Nitrosospira sp. Nsp1]
MLDWYHTTNDRRRHQYKNYIAEDFEGTKCGNFDSTWIDPIGQYGIGGLFLLETKSNSV